MSFDYILAFREGHANNCAVADILRECGLQDVEVPEWSMHQNQAELEEKTRNEKDILVGNLYLELKTSSQVFNDIDDFPFTKIIVDTVHGFDSKTIKPFAYIHKSQKGSGIFVTPVASKPHWTIATVYDAKRQVEFEAYFVDKRYTRPFTELVEVLLERQADRASEV